MAAKAAGENAAGSATQAKVPVATVLIATMLGVWLGLGGAGGGLYYLVKSGKLKLPAMSSAAPGSVSTPGEGAHTMVLEPILVNLADPGGHAYLRLGLTLNLEGEAAKPEGGEPKTGKGPTEQELAVRDTVLAVLGQQTSTWLLGPDGKEHLKVELEEAIAKHNPQVRVKDVFFTDFLVQI